MVKKKRLHTQPGRKGSGSMSQKLLDTLAEEMMLYDFGDARRTFHFIQVHDLARRIALGENVPSDIQFITEAAALVHDIGIHNCEKKYGACPGPLQEREGPPEAEKILRRLGFSEAQTSRICELVGRHHTYQNVDSMDLQILIEADFLVNLHEDGCSKNAVHTSYDKHFKTKTGRRLCRTIYGLDEKA